MISHNLQIVATCVAIFTFGLSSPGSLIHQPGSTQLSEIDLLKTPQDTTVSFSQNVLPILERTCQRCHGGKGDDGEVVVEEGLDMTTYEMLMAGSLYGTVVEPGDPDGSYLFELIVSGDMPKEGDALTPEEIEMIRQWIAAGAENN